MVVAAAKRLSQPMLYSTEEDRWTAVIQRDSQADGVFYYSVATTGVYCRPSCAARLPRRENVRFHLTCQAAEDAGFRSCKRCRPNQPALELEHVRAIENACRVLGGADELPNLDQLAANSGMSRFHFQRIFKSVSGVTPRAFFAQGRTQKLHDRLKQSESVTEAIYSSGFGSSGRFYESSSEMLGMTPSAFRAGGRGETIRFAVGQCSLGAILVAATTKGICSILLGDDPIALLHDLERRFPEAHLIGGDKEFEAYIATVVGLVETPALSFNLPLDVRGTAFQQRVWQALRDIPAGATASYTEIAARIAAPQAVRAVARACASNPLAIAIPCHRVVRSNGALAGYRWGVERKRALLQREEISK